MYLDFLSGRELKPALVGCLVPRLILTSLRSFIVMEAAAAPVLTPPNTLKLQGLQVSVELPRLRPLSAIAGVSSLVAATVKLGINQVMKA